MGMWKKNRTVSRVGPRFTSVHVGDEALSREPVSINHRKKLSLWLWRVGDQWLGLVGLFANVDCADFENGPVIQRDREIPLIVAQ